MKTNKLETVKSNTENDLALARAEQSENSTPKVGGALPAAPCSACGDELSEHDERFFNAIKWMEIVQRSHEEASEIEFNKRIDAIELRQECRQTK